MSKLRFKVVKEASTRKPVKVEIPSSRPESYYASAVFNRQKMFEYLPRLTFDKLVAAIEEKKPITQDIADSVAEGMKRWAIDNVSCLQPWLSFTVSTLFFSIRGTIMRYGLRSFLTW